MTYLRLAGVVPESVVDGPGVRCAVFFQGCAHRCPGCHNPQTWDFEGGRLTLLEEVLERLDNPLLEGITLTGGDPFYRVDEVLALLRAVNADYPGLTAWAYTGFAFENFDLDDPKVGEVLNRLDALVDGPYVEAERDLALRFRGSANQRVLDPRESLRRRRAVWLRGWSDD